MRLFISVLVLIFSFQSLVKADDIRDFQIEGMSVGDSLLDYFSEEEITKKKFYYPKSKKFAAFAKEVPSFETYEAFQVHFKDDDKEASEFWKSEKNRQVGLVEKGKAWVQSTLLPIKLGGMSICVPFHEYPQCVLDML